jgi:hypothetical protein
VIPVGAGEGRIRITEVGEGGEEKQQSVTRATIYVNKYFKFFKMDEYIIILFVI